MSDRVTLQDLLSGADEFDDEQLDLLINICCKTDHESGLKKNLENIFRKKPKWFDEEYLIPICSKIATMSDEKTLNWINFFLAADWTDAESDDLTNKLIWGHRNHIPVCDIATNLALELVMFDDKKHVKNMLYDTTYPFFDPHICFIVSLLDIDIEQVSELFLSYVDKSHNSLKLYLQTILVYKMSIYEVKNGLVYAFRTANTPMCVISEFELYGARLRDVTMCCKIGIVPNGVLFKFNGTYFRTEWKDEFEKAIKEYQLTHFIF